MIVIADDITGAAEIAGIAHSYGMQVILSCTEGDSHDCESSVPDGHPSGAVFVIATDTRSLTEEEAASEIRRITAAQPTTSPTLLFKKTDSALRGHVVAELAALLESTHYQRAVYLPANPSKNRIVRDGTYLINDVPIHQTAFSYDPEYPATVSKLKERFPDATEHHIIMPDATSADDIRHVIAEYDDGNTLFAGAADLFSALLQHFLQPRQTVARQGSKTMAGGSKKALTDADKPLGHTSPTDGTIILCGCTQSRQLDIGLPVANMPAAVYDGHCDTDTWDTTAYTASHRIILAIPHTHRTGRQTAIHLRNMMARKTKALIDEYCPRELIIEGGATAWTTLKTLGWRHFHINRQIAPGVVEMLADNGTFVTLKPGSYPWGSMIQQLTYTSQPTNLEIEKE